MLIAHTALRIWHAFRRRRHNVQFHYIYHYLYFCSFPSRFYLNSKSIKRRYACRFNTKYNNFPSTLQRIAVVVVPCARETNAFHILAHPVIGNIIGIDKGREQKHSIKTFEISTESFQWQQQETWTTTCIQNFWSIWIKFTLNLDFSRENCELDF